MWHDESAMADKQSSGWRHWLDVLARRLHGRRTDDVPPHLRKPFIRRGWRYTTLQFTAGEAQSRMLTRRPDVLLIDYTRTMMAALLWQPQPRRVGMVGLGGGSQAKFCYRHLPEARIEVVEINPHVVALRREFRIPDDDARFVVVLDDGARFVAARPGRYDLLLVDGYDETGIPEALASQRFYDDCRDALADGGVAAFNLYGDDVERHLDRLRRSFGERLLVVGERAMSNRVAFGWRGDPLPAPPFGLPTLLGRLPVGVRAELMPVFERVGAALLAQTAQQR